MKIGKIKREEKRALTIDEQKLLIEKLKENMDMFSRRTLFYLCTGARPTKILTINKDEIRPSCIKINKTKSDGSVRWVKVSEKISEMIAGESKEFFHFTLKRYR